MAYEITLGRTEDEEKELGKRGMIFFGKKYVTMGKTTSMGNDVLLDVTKPHVMLISGKRGSGKSYTMAAMAEGMAKLPKEVKNKLGMVMIDPLGIYWTTKYPNYRQEELLEDWDMEPQDFKDKVKVVVPYGKRDEYEDVGVPVDESFSLKTASLSGGEWCSTFGIELTEPYGILISRVIRRLKEKGEDYSISDIKTEVERDERASKREKDAVINFFEAAESWGLFEKKGKTLKDLVEPGKITVIDISTYAHLGGFSVRSLVVGLLVRKMMEERMKARRVEEMAAVERGWRVFESEEYEKKEEEQIPLIWLFLDEAHEFLPMESEGMVPSTEPLRTAIREGRQPGVSIVMATQQPGKIHSDVLTQSDIVLSHRLTAKLDIEALQEIMQTYLAKSIKSYIDQLPDRKGAAIILDDKQERIYPIQVRPRYTWHGGREPSAIEIKKEIEEL